MDLVTALETAARDATVGTMAGPPDAPTDLGGLVVDISPEIGRWLFGSTGPGTAGLIAKAIEAATGTNDAAAARAVLGQKPEAVSHLRLQLATIAAQRQAELDQAAEAERAATLAALRTAMASRPGTRQVEAHAQEYSRTAWAPAAMSAIILAAFAVMLFVLLRGDGLPSTSMPLANVLLGTLAAMATQVANYWLGSSSGSAAKSSQISALSQTAQSSVPGDIVHRLLPPVGPPPAAGQVG